MAAADQIAIQIPKTRIKEGSSFTATAYLRTRSASAAASVPTTVKWRLDCKTTGREIVALTSLTAAANVSIAISGVHNAIQSDANDFETKQLTVIVDDGLSTQVRETKTWTVENLYGSP